MGLSESMRHGSLFSGIGGFDLAAEWMGWENVFHCEFNPFCQKILKYYWPDAISYSDITTTDFSIHRGEIDILTGGFPCQPFSQAGRRKGKEDDRYLWPEMLRAIREIQPTWVVAENVYGIINQGRGLVFEEVCAQMENEGYEVQPYLLPACAVNAPHRRDRFWFVGYSASYRRQGEGQEIENKNWQSQSRHGRELAGGFKGLCSNGVTSDPERFRQSRQGRAERQSGSTAAGDWKASWSHANDRWPTQSPIRGRNDGLSAKLSQECLSALGNAIVPQVAYEIFKAIKCVTSTLYS